MTVTDLLNAAREEAKLQPLSESELERDKFFYDLYLEDMLEERDWLFAYGKSTNLTLTQPDTDLGYKYVYIVGNTDVLDVLHINQVAPVIPINFQRTIEYGYTTDPITDEVSPNSGSYIFVNGLLHSTVPVTQIYYKKEPTPVNMPSSFRMFLIYTLGARLAKFSSDKELEGKLQAKAEKYHLRAARFEHQLNKNNELQDLYRFIKTYRTQTNFRYS